MPHRALLLLAASTSYAWGAAPTASNSSTTVNEDVSTTIRLVATDPERQSMTYSIVTPPTRGTYSISGSTVTYRGNSNVNGADSFTWRARDSGGSYSGSATASISITAVNDAPTGAAQSTSTNEDTAKSISLTGADVDNTALTYAISTAPTNGTASVNSSTGVATYTPPANWSGSTTFRYTVSDGAATSAANTVTVTVVAVNDAPTASATSGTLSEDGSLNVTVTGSDVDSSGLTYALASQPSHGTASISSRTITYTPTANYNGADQLTFTVSDGSATSAAATVSLTVSGVNDAPTVSAGTATTTEDHPVTVTLVGSDVDGNALTYSVYGSVVNGTLAISGTQATFTPTSNYTGSGRFSFRAYDGTAYSGSATVTVTINAANDPPTASAQTVSTSEDTSVMTTLSGTDPESAPLTYALAGSPTHGTVSLNNRAATYVPEANWSGTDSYTFTVNDGTSTSSPATVTVNVAAVNDPPTVYETWAMTEGSTNLTIDVHSVDVDSTLPAPTIVSAATHGAARIQGGLVTYDPSPGYLGVDHFTIQLSDGTSSATAQVHVSHVGDPAGANAQWAQVGTNSIPFYADAADGGIQSASAIYEASYIFGDLYDLGIESYRQLRSADVTWESFEIPEGVFFYDDSDVVLGTGEIDPRPTLFDTMYASPTPSWATTTAEFQKSMNPDAYRYLDDVLARYADDVRMWEIGNEMFHWVALDDPTVDPSTIPDMPASYPTDGYSPEEQAEFLRDAADYVRAGDPDAIIVLPSILPNSDATDEWIERVIAHVGSDWFDVVSWHGYNEWNYQAGDRTQMRADLESWGLQDKLVQLTETGTSAYATQTAKTNYPNSESTQAADVFRLLVHAFASGDSAVFWHTYRELTEDDASTFGGLGLFDFDTTPRLAAYTMQLFTTELLPLTQATNLSASGQYVYALKNSAGEGFRVVWGSGSYAVPSGFTQYTSVVPASNGSFTWSAVPASLTLSETPWLVR